MLVRSATLCLLLMILWQSLCAYFQFPDYVLPSPSSVAHSFYKNAEILLINFLPTFFEIVLGLFLGILLGAGVALMMGNGALLRQGLLSIIIISQAIPIFALAPLLVLWFGYGMLSKIITIILMLFFPVASSFYDGLRRTPNDWLDMAQIMKGTRFATLWHLRLPAALPSLAAGIRVATVIAPMGAIISEWVGASRGLGFLMLDANARLQTDLLFACIITIMLMSLLLYAVVDKVLRRFISW